MTNLAIECENIQTSYLATLNRPILNGVNCTIKNGEFVALLGLNGAGKSTLLRAIAGLIPLEKGMIKIHGLTRNNQNKSTVGMLVQGGGLIKQLSAIDNVLCGLLGKYSAWQTLGGFGKSDRRLALQLLDQFGLKDQAYQKAGQLSGGQQQKVAIARTLIQSPEILLADEPTTGLDVLASHQVMEILAQLHKQNMTIVVVLHDLELAAKYAQRAIIFNQGNIIYDGKSEQISTEFTKLNQI